MIVSVVCSSWWLYPLRMSSQSWCLFFTLSLQQCIAICIAIIILARISWIVSLKVEAILVSIVNLPYLELSNYWNRLVTIAIKVMYKWVARIIRIAHILRWINLLLLRLLCKRLWEKTTLTISIRDRIILLLLLLHRRRWIFSVNSSMLHLKKLLLLLLLLLHLTLLLL